MSNEKTSTFGHKIDKRSRTAMVAFLNNHFRYYTANSWNRSTSYANNVKIHNLPIPAEFSDIAYDIAYGAIQSPDFIEICDEEIRSFYDDTGYYAGFNGRSGGYLVMYETKLNDKTDTVITFCGRSIDQYEDFDDKDNWPMWQLKERVELVQRFDQMCDNILNRFIDLLKNSEIQTVTEVITNDHQILVAKNKDKPLDT